MGRKTCSGTITATTAAASTTFDDYTTSDASTTFDDYATSDASTTFDDYTTSTTFAGRSLAAAAVEADGGIHARVDNVGKTSGSVTTFDGTDPKELKKAKLREKAARQAAAKARKAAAKAR